jgi:hypothetical protein
LRNPSFAARPWSRSSEWPPSVKTSLDDVTGTVALGTAEREAGACRIGNVKASLPNFTYTSAMSAGWFCVSWFVGRISGLLRCSNGHRG